MIEAVFFDFGGVIQILDPDEMHRLEQKYGLPAGGFWRALYEKPEPTGPEPRWWSELEIDAGQEGAYLEAVQRRLDQLAGRRIPGIRDEWAQVFRGQDESLMELAVP